MGKAGCKGPKGGWAEKVLFSFGGVPGREVGGKRGSQVKY